MNIKYKECKGCEIINKCTIKPIYIYNDHKEKCPCIKCLVKGICGIPCRIYDEYVLDNHLNRETNEDNTITECPCIKCFIKGTCSIACKEYNDYYARNI